MAAHPADDALSGTSENAVQNKVIKAALDEKVDAVPGKGLSANDFTSEEKAKLAGVEAGAQVNPDLSGYATKTEVSAGLGGKVDKVSGKGLSANDYTTAEKNKLAGIEAGAQVNPDLSGYATKSEMNTALGEKADSSSVHNIPAGGTAGQVLKKRSGTDYDAEWAEESGGGGSVPVDDALSGTSENPVQNKVVKDALDEKVDKVSGKGLSTNDFTTTEKSKLAGIQAGAQVNPKLSVNGERQNIVAFTKDSISGISGVWLFAGVEDETVIFFPDIEGFNTGAQSILSQVHSIPSGGTAGQFLVKQSATDYDAAWVTVPNANGVSF